MLNDKVKTITNQELRNEKYNNTEAIIIVNDKINFLKELMCTKEKLKMQSSQYPPENDYNAVRKWLENEKKQGRDHLKDYKDKTALCRELSEMFEWNVEAGSLRRNINRHIKNK